MPWVSGMHKWIHQIEEARQAIFVGFFGPIGFSAVFYLFASLEFIEEHLSSEDSVPRSDVENLGETIRVVVWFLAVFSIVVHELSIPLGKVGYLAPRTPGRVLSESLSDEPRAVVARHKIPVLGRYLVGKPKDVEYRLVQRTTVISRSLDSQYSRSEASTLGDLLQSSSSPASQIGVEPATMTHVPLRREREIWFPDESQVRRDGWVNTEMIQNSYLKGCYTQ